MENIAQAPPVVINHSQSEIPQSITPATPPSKSNKFLLSFVVLVFLIAVGVGAYIFGTKQTQDTPQQAAIVTLTQPQPSPTPNPTANWKIFTDSRYNYTFLYPPEFQISTPYPPNVQLSINLDDEAQKMNYASVNFLKDTPTDKDPEEIAKQWIGNDIQITTISGLKAAKAVEKVSPIGISPSRQGASILHVYTVYKKDLYIFNLTTYNLPKFTPVFDQILQTFKFTP